MQALDLGSGGGPRPTGVPVGGWRPPSDQRGAGGPARRLSGALRRRVRSRFATLEVWEGQSPAGWGSAVLRFPAPDPSLLDGTARARGRASPAEGRGCRRRPVRVRELAGPQRGATVHASTNVKCTVWARGPGQDEWARVAPWAGSGKAAAEDAATSGRSCSRSATSSGRPRPRRALITAPRVPMPPCDVLPRFQACLDPDAATARFCSSASAI